MWSIYNPEGGAPFYLNPQLSIGAPRVEYGAWTDWPSASRWLVPQYDGATDDGWGILPFSWFFGTMVND